MIKFLSKVLLLNMFANFYYVLFNTVIFFNRYCFKKEIEKLEFTSSEMVLILKFCVNKDFKTTNFNFLLRENLPRILNYNELIYIKCNILLIIIKKKLIPYVQYNMKSVIYVLLGIGYLRSFTKQHYTYI